MTDKQIIERELLYEGLDWSVGVDGIFINPKQIPYTNCLYELALACDSKSKQLARKEQENKDLREDIKDIANLLDLDTGEEYNFGNIELEIKQLKAKEQECEKAKQNAQDTYDLWQALIESFNILQGEKIKLEQECEELKINNAQFIKDNEFLAKRNSKLKAENETLFKAIEEVNKINKRLESENKELKEILNEGCLHNLTLMTEQRVLLQTLAEIKEICKNVMPTGIDEETDKFGDILDIINEVENDN